MFEVLFVCEGNVCRSPFGERLLAHRFEERGAQDRFSVASMGLRAAVGSPMHPLSAAGLEALGGNADDFASRQLTPAGVRDAGLVLIATRELRSRMLEENPAALRKSFTIVEFAALASSAPAGLSLAQLIRGSGDRRSQLAGRDTDIEDPIRREPEVFDRVAAKLDRVVTAIANALVRTTD